MRKARRQHTPIRLVVVDHEHASTRARRCRGRRTAPTAQPTLRIGNENQNSGALAEHRAHADGRRPSARRAGSRSTGPDPCHRNCAWWKRPPARTAGTAFRGLSARCRCRCREPRSGSTGASSVPPCATTSTAISPALVNLMALPIRLIRHCTDALRIADHLHRHVRMHVDDELQAFGRRLECQRRADIFHVAGQVHFDRIDVELAGLDLGEVENVVDDGEERIGARRGWCPRTHAASGRAACRAAGSSCR